MIEAQLLPIPSDISSIPQSVIQLLSGGRTNLVWREGSRVLKRYLPCRESLLFPNDIRSEVICLQHFSSLGLTPCLLDFGDDWVALPFLSGGHWRRGAAEVGRLLSRLHRSPAPAGLRKLKGGSAALGRQTQYLLRRAAMSQNLPKIGRIHPARRGVIHGDPVPANIMRDQGRLVFIDWQCPAIAEPAEDLAIFLSPAMQFIYRGKPLSPREEHAFFQGYANAAVARRYLALRPLYRLRMIAHCRLRAKAGDKLYRQAAQLEAQALRRERPDFRF